MVNATIRGAGYHLVASHKGKTYYCMYQDGLRLYFLLPESTKSFVIKGRVMPDGKRRFTGRYVVDVKESADEKTTEDEPPESTKTEEVEKTE